MKRKRMKSLLAALLSLMMVFTYVPSVAFAAEAPPSDEPAAEAEAASGEDSGEEAKTPEKAESEDAAEAVSEEAGETAQTPEESTQKGSDAAAPQKAPAMKGAEDGNENGEGGETPEGDGTGEEPEPEPAEGSIEEGSVSFVPVDGDRAVLKRNVNGVYNEEEQVFQYSYAFKNGDQVKFRYKGDEDDTVYTVDTDADNYGLPENLMLCTWNQAIEGDEGTLGCSLEEYDENRTLIASNNFHKLQ